MGMKWFSEQGGHLDPDGQARLRTGHFDTLRTGMGGPPWAVSMVVVRVYRGVGLAGWGKLAWEASSYLRCGFAR